MDDKELMEESEETSGFKIWLEDNLRILLSILVVVAIAGGIYSYSKRTQAPAVTDTAAEETIAEENVSPENSKEIAPQDGKKPAENGAVKPGETAKAAPVTAESRETESAFVEVAAKGMGETHLARQALANYLEKNPDSALTKEHKIYIEDYLRKQNSFNGRVHVGTSVEFQKNLIQDAITKAKTLNESQLDNLKKYSARVSSLS